VAVAEGFRRRVGGRARPLGAQQRRGGRCGARAHLQDTPHEALAAAERLGNGAAAAAGRRLEQQQQAALEQL
jgi:hypothetical protein